MEWSTPIDLYCERTDPTFWAEPANALSNAAFLIAAAVAFWSWRRRGGRDWPALALIVAAVAVGFGSFAFHTVATRGARLADVIPIAIFIYGYLLLALRRFVHLSTGASVAIVVLYAAGAQAAAWLAPPGALNGSIGYLPALVALIAVARATRGPARRGLELAVMVFTVSLALRTIDLAACETFPRGTHFLWHLLNAVVLYVLLRTAVGEGGSQKGPVGRIRLAERNPPTSGAIRFAIAPYTFDNRHKSRAAGANSSSIVTSRSVSPWACT